MGTHYAVESGTLVALCLAVHFVLAGTELAEILGSPWDDVFKELKGDTA